MRDKNENIHLFILEEERRRNRALVFKNRILREKFLTGESQGQTGQPSRQSQDSYAIFEGLHEKEDRSLGDKNLSSGESQESDSGAAERVAIVNRGLRPLKPGIFGLKQKSQGLKIWLITSAIMVTCSLISIVALLKLDAVVHQDLYSYGLYFSLEWATPYWFAIRTALGMLSLMIIITALSLVYALYRRTGRGTDELCNTYTLADGSTIRVKTVVKGVKRLNTYDHDGKPVYSVVADNVAEVIKR